MIPKERQVMLFRDVEEYIPEEFKGKLKLVEEIISSDDEKLEKVFSYIRKSSESINFIHKVIQHTLLIRFHNRETLFSLISLVEKEFGEATLKEVKMIKKVADSISKANFTFMIQDDVDTFIKTMTTFDPRTHLSIKLLPRSILDATFSEVSLLQLLAYYGSVKCFKYALINEDYNLIHIEYFAVAGGNMEIISMLEHKGVSFAGCMTTSIEFHRYEISDWILIHYQCSKMSLFYATMHYNYRAFFFAILNGIVFDSYLSFASQNGHLDTLKYLIEEFNCEIDNIYFSHKTLLHYACENGYLDIVKYLIEECHANIKVGDKCGNTPLHLATQFGHFSIIKYLVEECHCEVEVKAKEGSTPLHYACANGYLDIVKYFIEECKCHTEVQTNYGKTPVHMASQYGHWDIVKYFIENGFIQITCIF